MSAGDNPGHASREFNRMMDIDNEDGSVIPSKKKSGKKTKFTKGNEVIPKYSSLEQRYEIIPGSESTVGHWEGEPGESMFVSEDPRVIEILNKHKQKGVVYKNGMPDFSPFVVAEFEIDMTEERDHNFALAKKQLAKKWTEETGEKWTSKKVGEWMKENSMTWHELNDCKTIQLVPSAINHPIFKHLGGVGEIKIAKRKGEL